MNHIRYNDNLGCPSRTMMTYHLHWCPPLLWARRWLWRPILDFRMRGQLGQGKRWESLGGASIAFFLLSRALTTSTRLFVSNRSLECPTKVRHMVLSCALGSSCFGASPALVMSDFTQSLNRLMGLPRLRFPKDSSPYIRCFGSLWSSIRITCPTQRSLL